MNRHTNDIEWFTPLDKTSILLLIPLLRNWLPDRCTKRVYIHGSIGVNMSNRIGHFIDQFSPLSRVVKSERQVQI